MTTLRIYVERAAQARYAEEFLLALNNAYNHLYHLDLIARGETWPTKPPTLFLKKLLEPVVKHFGYKLVEISDALVLEGDRLSIARVQIGSPGFWDVIGQLNPLQQLREYFKDRHERMKDKTYKIQFEKDRLQLENEHLKMKVFREQIAALRELGYSDKKIRKLIERHGILPLRQLDKPAQYNMVIEGEIIELEDDERQF